MTPDPSLHLFGIRHHGPGSARSLLQSLEMLQPDLLLIEGPPEAETLLPLVMYEQMQPPVAMLLYVPDTPHLAAYYPLASFSPEWQALQFGLQQQIPIRFMDLPQSHQLVETPEPKPQAEAAPEVQQESPELDPAESSDAEDLPEANPSNLTAALERDIRRDPLLWLAQAAGFSDGERWWEQFVEQRQDSTDVFDGILEAMTALRTAVEAQFPPSLDNERDRREALREAYMRQTIRQAQKEGFTKIAVVCGAWHTPALVPPFPASKADAALLKGLPKAKVSATWVPWTYERLTVQSGYGAGVDSPGWYEHLWQVNDSPSERWLVKIARLLRQKDLDASSASIIEAVRMAEALAALRDHSAPGLPELSEAVQSVLCFGDTAPLQLIHRQLIVGDCLGSVPDETPMVPLQQDLRRIQQRLRLKPEALDKELVLDLRKEMDLGRSYLLHRLNLLNISWGEVTEVSGKGTFKEKWLLRWRPELELALIDAGRWGNTVEAAATAFACDQAAHATQLSTLTALLEQVLLSTLTAAVHRVMERLEAAAALTSDLIHLMAAVPALANVLRYRDVRQTDVGTLTHVVDGLVARICVGLPSACASLDDVAAGQMLEQLVQTHRAIKLLQDERHHQDWMATLLRLADQSQLHGLLAGRCCRLLLDENQLDGTEAARRLNLALSRAVEPAHAADWIEGFLQGSGLLLLHDPEIWAVLDQWVLGLQPEDFIILLPLLRRTFAAFTGAERRQMLARVKQGPLAPKPAAASDLDHERAALALPLVAQLLGLELAR